QRIARDRIRQEPAALRDFSPAFVRFGSKADAASPRSHVRFAPKSEQIAGAPNCPLVPKADSCTAATTHAACLSDHLIGGREKSGRGGKARIYSSDNILTVHYSHAVDALFSCNRKPLGKPPGPPKPSLLDDRVDSDAILEDIRSIVEIESPSRSAPGVNRVLETIARLFEGTGAAWERELTTDSFGDILLVRCDPTRNEPGILVL